MPSWLASIAVGVAKYALERLWWGLAAVGLYKRHQQAAALRTASERNELDEEFAGLSGDDLADRVRKSQS